jgi:hypothetical protein
MGRPCPLLSLANRLGMRRDKGAYHRRTYAYASGIIIKKVPPVNKPICARDKGIKNSKKNFEISIYCVF